MMGRRGLLCEILLGEVTDFGFGGVSRVELLIVCERFLNKERFQFAKAIAKRAWVAVVHHGGIQIWRICKFLLDELSRIG